MYPLVMVAAGAVLFVCSIFLCAKLIRLVKWPYMRKEWQAALYLMYFVLLVYALYAYAVATGRIKFALDSTIFSAVLFFGAAFVFLIIRAGYHLVDWLAESETEVITNKRIMVYDKGMLEKDKKDLELKRYELETALEEVYALRQDIEKGKRIGMKRLNKRLEKIKANTKST